MEQANKQCKCKENKKDKFLEDLFRNIFTSKRQFNSNVK